MRAGAEQDRSVNCIRWIAWAWILGTGLTPVWARVEGDLSRKASWTQPTAEAVKGQLDQWLLSQQASDESRRKAYAAWDTKDVAGDEGILDRLGAAFAAVDAESAKVLEACRRDSAAEPASFRSLFDETSPEFVRFNLRLIYGRWLVRHTYYDEAVVQLDGIQPQQVADPAALLFYPAVAHHRLLQKDKCLRSLAVLLENEVHLPSRYRLIAKLMEADIKPLETDSLDEIARLMDDVRRRLNLGHAGKRVRKQEDDVVAKLDKMIEEMEQQQQQQQSASQSSGGAQSSNPADDSRPLGGSGPGDVDQKKIGSKSGWGNLPPKEREEALQQISKDLPAHYREVIEEYFRKLAREGGR